MKNASVQLIDRHQLDSMQWPETKDGHYARKFLEPFLRNGVNYYIDNIKADAFILKIKNFVFPIIVVHENYDNSYVCSPYGHFISYGKEHIALVTNPLLRHPIKFLLNGLGKCIKKGRINSVIYVNNWLFAVDLYPQGISSEDIAQIVHVLSTRFPHHAIVFRSLNEMTTAPLIQALEHQGFKFIPSRYVHLTDTKNDSIFKTRILKSDLKLVRESSFQLIDETQIDPEDYPQLLDLYHLFYIDQHSHLNPQFNPRFIELMLEQKLMKFKILKKNESIKGIAGYFERGGILYCPIFGYDKNDPENTHIYRYLSTALLLEAKQNQWIFHQSAGASFYKSIRRAEGYMEYMGVYTPHLSYQQKISWKCLRTLINLSSPFIKNY